MRKFGFTRKGLASDAPSGRETRHRFGFVPFLVLIGALAANVLPSTMTLTTVYPAPSGVYRVLITTGGTPSNPYNTILTRDAGNVGIGTNNPATKLEIDAAGSGSAAVTLRKNSNLTSDRLWIDFRNSDGDMGYFGYAGNDNNFFLNNSMSGGLVRIHAPGAVTLVDDGQGNVGIGTGSPQYKLDVAGQIRSASGGFVFPDGTTQTTAAGGSSTALSVTIVSKYEAKGGVTVTCPAGTQVTGGGCDLTNWGVYLYASQPSSNTSWYCFAGPGGGATVLGAYAVCAH